MSNAADSPSLFTSQLMQFEVLDAFKYGPTQYVDGKPIKGQVSPYQIRGNVQPLNGRDLLLVPEADRFKEQYFVWTFCLVNVNDLVVRCGANYQVQNVETWGRYNKCRIMRIDTGPYQTP